DGTLMEKMTGGPLPAATWHEVMQYAHQGIELKPLPGRPAPPAPQAPAASASADGPRRPPSLSAEAASALTAIETSLRASQAKSIDSAITMTDPARNRALSGKPAGNARQGGGG